VGHFAGFSNKCWYAFAVPWKELLCMVFRATTTGAVGRLLVELAQQFAAMGGTNGARQRFQTGQQAPAGALELRLQPACRAARCHAFSSLRMHQERPIAFG